MNFDQLHDFEEQFLSKVRKQGRQDRKHARDKDRSKYKKTDFEKFQDELEKEILSKLDPKKLKRGQVISIKSEGILVTVDHKEWVCTLRGLLKKTRTHAKNLVAVGDFVLFEPLSKNEGAIAYVEKRHSILCRSDTLSQNKQQVIAANVDQVLITTAVITPELKPSLVDRYLISALKGNLQPVILINKIDLVPEEDEFLMEFIATHRKMGIPVVEISCVTGKGIEELKEVLKNKLSVFSGQSGVGKSSLINAVTGLNLKTGEIVEKTEKGSHTTTSALLLPLPFGGFIIDTPGVKSFGVWDLSKEELPFYFQEFEKYLPYCKFSGCTHLHEPDCAVLEAVERGEISPQRYRTYLTLAEEIQQEHFRR